MVWIALSRAGNMVLFGLGKSVDIPNDYREKRYYTTANDPAKNVLLFLASLPRNSDHPDHEQDAA